MAAKRKGAPKFKADPLAAVTASRLASAKASRKPTVKGTFHHGTNSASSSNRGVKAGGHGQHRDSKGRFK